MKEIKIPEHINYNEGIFNTTFNMIAPIVPANMYWLDLNNRILGLNQRTVDAIRGIRKLRTLLVKLLTNTILKKLPMN